MYSDTQELVRRLLRTKMSDQARAEACIPLPEGITWYEGMLKVMEHFGEDASSYPQELGPDE